MTIGDRIKEARERASLSQQQLADALGIRASGRQRVCGWESGLRTPLRTTIDQIAAITGVTPAWIAYGVGEMHVDV